MRKEKFGNNNVHYGNKTWKDQGYRMDGKMKNSWISPKNKPRKKIFMSDPYSYTFE